MKLIINIPGAAIPTDITIQDICRKINKMVDHVSFALQSPIEENVIELADNCNCECHTKLVLLLGLFVNSYNPQYRCHIHFQARHDLPIRVFLGTMPKSLLMGFLNSIGDITKVSVQICS